MKQSAMRPHEFRAGMPVIPVAMVPKSRNVYVITSCDYRRGEATCSPLSRFKQNEYPGSLTTGFKNLVPLDYFGVLIAANTRLNLFAALPSSKISNRTHEIIGKTLAWQPDKASRNATAETQAAVRDVLRTISPRYFVRADENV